MPTQPEIRIDTIFTYNVNHLYESSRPLKDFNEPNLDSHVLAKNTSQGLWASHPHSLYSSALIRYSHSPHTLSKRSCPGVLQAALAPGWTAGTWRSCRLKWIKSNMTLNRVRSASPQASPQLLVYIFFLSCIIQPSHSDYSDHPAIGSTTPVIGLERRCHASPVSTSNIHVVGESAREVAKEPRVETVWIAITHAYYIPQSYFATAVAAFLPWSS